MKYALYREDYMNELFPNGYTKPIIMSSKVSFDSNNQNAFLFIFSKNLLNVVELEKLNYRFIGHDEVLLNEKTIS